MCSRRAGRSRTWALAEPQRNAACMRLQPFGLRQRHRRWADLAEGGAVGMPLEAAPWGASFGQLTDRFGVSWMVNIAAPPLAARGVV